jgi:drug/metabolite transporter (DMT)-like permease
VLGSCAHYCATQAFRVADVSATQPVRFLDLIWATLMGFLVFGDVPTTATLLGGLVIFAATTWVARREAGIRRTPLAVAPRAERA